MGKMENPMRPLEAIALTAALAFASTALAHQGVRNMGVMARMDGMLSAQKATKVLIDMASGTRSFDARAAQRAKAAILQNLAQVPELFKTPHDDPKSEALPVIWVQHDDFLTRNAAAITAMTALQTGTRAALQDTLPKAGAACLDCHQTYRLNTKN